MDTYLETHYNEDNNENQQEVAEEHQNSGLLRYRSAPSSLFFDYTQNLSDINNNNDNNNININNNSNNNGYFESYERKPQKLSESLQGGYSNMGQMTHLPPQYPKQSLVSSCSNSMEKSLEINHSINGGGGFNLNRQTSSPAGFFGQPNTQNGYTLMRGIGSFRVGSGTNGESGPRSGRLGMNHLPRIPEIQNENVKETSPDDVKFRNHDVEFDTPTGFVSWSDSGSDASHLSQTGGLSQPPMLTHHLSLPKTSTEMAAIEKLLQFQDTVPCKVRAKRGFATHPRSIAERERRNRISERMRKLQELVPNMDKQTNTADMLDLAVDYIKGLQDEFKVLSDCRAKCRCVDLQ
ncbi:hypothetical protein RND81_12G037100 [Saponaria officinalis]|uniref:BHLH domain-containing protein n=1 Tax=Saponaria officinalis TaxID=3572 RepID=A0AAW1H4M5_SAPOF